MTIKGQKAPRRHYKAELAEMYAIAKTAERRAGERLTLLEAESDAVERLRIALSEAKALGTYFYRDFIAMAIAALLEGCVLFYLLTTR